MASRCKHYTDNNSLDVSKLNYIECSNILAECLDCEHYYYCPKVTELLDRLRELEEYDNE